MARRDVDAARPDERLQADAPPLAPIGSNVERARRWVRDVSGVLRGLAAA